MPMRVLMSARDFANMTVVVMMTVVVSVFVVVLNRLVRMVVRVTAS